MIQMPRLPLDQLAARAARLRLLLFDVDGVLTDGTVLLHADGVESKAFHIRDGAAIVWAGRAGLRTGVISARSSAATTRRASELKMHVVAQGVADKRAAYEDILVAQGLTDADVSFMGDDLLDLPILVRTGLSAAPADAAPDVRARVHWVSTEPGGRGAVREFIELVLRARGQWDAIVEPYLT
jgi:3-deoxy-D-manno-octulosonate 8-phosphate phosphatase (KDO 8-P phosphatase)